MLHHQHTGQQDDEMEGCEEPTEFISRVSASPYLDFSVDTCSTMIHNVPSAKNASLGIFHLLPLCIFPLLYPKTICCGLDELWIYYTTQISTEQNSGDSKNVICYSVPLNVLRNIFPQRKIFEEKVTYGIFDINNLLHKAV